MSRWIDADALMKGLPTEYLGSTAHLLINSAPSIDLVRCAECHWARPRTLKGETGYRCVFYRVDKAENGYCDIGEREAE